MRVIVPQARIDGAAARQDDRQRRFPRSRSDTLCIRCDRGDDRGRRGRERGSDRGTRKTCRRSPTNYKYVRQYTEKGTRATKPAVSEPHLLSPKRPRTRSNLMDFFLLEGGRLSNGFWPERRAVYRHH